MFLRFSRSKRFNLIKHLFSNQTGGFDSSEDTHKLIIWGIDKTFTHKKCYKFLMRNFNIEGSPIEHQITHLCKINNKPFFVIKMTTEINADQFKKLLSVTGKRIRVKPFQEEAEAKYSISQDNYIQLKQLEQPTQRILTEASQSQIIKVRQIKIEDLVTSLHRLPYEEQVDFKIKAIDKIIQKYNTSFLKDKQVRRLMSEQCKEIAPLILSQFIECLAEREGYRSKSQFTIGCDYYSRQAVVGFNKGSYTNNTIMIESPKNVNIISNSNKQIAECVQKFIRVQTKKEQFQELQPFDRIQQRGFWRYLIVRESKRTNQIMVILVCKTEGFSSDKVEAIKQNFKYFLKKSVVNLTSLCFIVHNGQADSIPTGKPELLYGTPFYQEIILGHNFRVSASAFLQIHIKMCEVLYQKIIGYVKDCEVVLDLGSGIGTIGISIMNKLKNVKVIGVQVCKQAVEDSKINQPQYEVYEGTVENHIEAICSKYSGKRIVAIVDPPRTGFNKSVMKALRKCWGLNTIVYVACNPGAIQDNLLQLTLPITKRRKCPQFLIKQMVGFDMFPQTPHIEVVYVMTRRQSRE